MTRPPQPLAKPRRLTDHSGTITKGGASQFVFSFDATLLGFMLQNIDRQAPLWFSLTGEADQKPGSFLLSPVQPGVFSSQSLFILPDGFEGVGALWLFAADAGHAFSCLSW